MQNQDLVQSSEGNLGIITLNRPERRNPLSLSLMLDLIRCLDEFGADESIRAVILASTGKVSAHFRCLQRPDDQDSIHPAAGYRAGARRGDGGRMPVGGQLRPGSGQHGSYICYSRC
jgi:enoyl-CoA hydratase/carnithine racemase